MDGNALNTEDFLDTNQIFAINNKFAIVEYMSFDFH